MLLNIQRNIRELALKAYFGLKGNFKFNGTFIYDFPKFVRIETTNNCNLSCIMCPHRFMRRKIGVIDFNLYKKIIDEISEYEVNSVELDLLGEPLLYPNLLIKMIKYAKSRKIRHVFFFTNCTFLTQDVARMLLHSGLDSIVLSVDGATKTTYEKIRRGACWEDVIEKVHTFLELRKKINRDLQVTLQILRMTETKEEINAFKEMWKPLLDRNCSIHIKEYHTWAGNITDRSTVSLKRMLKMLGASFLPCHQLWNTLNIHWNGDVVACCFDYDGVLKVGNCRDDKLRDIINGSRIRWLREMHLKGKLSELPLCNKCIER